MKIYFKFKKDDLILYKLIKLTIKSSLNNYQKVELLKNLKLKVSNEYKVDTDDILIISEIEYLEVIERQSKFSQKYSEPFNLENSEIQDNLISQNTENVIDNQYSFEKSHLESNDYIPYYSNEDNNSDSTYESNIINDQSRDDYTPIDYLTENDNPLNPDSNYYLRKEFNDDDNY